MSTPLLSVVMPCFNAQRWVEGAIDSILTQTHTHLELIVVDDGSSDSSVKRIRKIANTDARLRLLTANCNTGIVHALNYGIEEARGKFIARMDADDICMPNRLSQQISFLEQTSCDLCGSWFVEFGQGIPRTVRWPHTESALRAAMIFQNTICHPTVMARREVFEQFRYREAYQLAEDYDLFARASTKFRLANIPEPLLRYRRHPQQATQARRNDMEIVTRQIRLQALQAQGIEATPEEQRLHNLIRAPSSIYNTTDLEGIEAWLLKLYKANDDKEGKRIIASQWVRACIRAAPLGHNMWRIYRLSPLRASAGINLMTHTDLRILSALKLDYGSNAFSSLRRFGLSA
ncbi:glycosyl transferase family 2 [Nitrosococcus halophilus Nc 4]|uniref:Glycosyl transferase family 2 n=1 Tax=Nitrosococcus halophilus (strain Nc4) TaxID=472759 RepID=D5BWR7_NITHN|nr:glycosyltransferase [Nitrosococcus halophilus]ADE13798.1 glycosyl transferase family 2 [Nitrosococcus halophilus Nc 4]